MNMRAGVARMGASKISVSRYNERVKQSLTSLSLIFGGLFQARASMMKGY